MKMIKMLCMVKLVASMEGEKDGAIGKRAETIGNMRLY